MHSILRQPKANFAVAKFGFNLLVIVLCLAVGLVSCSKSSGDEDDLVGNWKRSSEFEGVGRTEAVTFVIDNKVYVGGGYDGTDRLNDFCVFDQSMGTWLQRASGAGINISRHLSVYSNMEVGLSLNYLWFGTKNLGRYN